MLCDKCRQPVDPANDAGIVESLFYQGTGETSHHRHLLPVDGCAGSPSRAQYLEGQPRDTRGYKYYPEDETGWRYAYERAQALAQK